jgi:succinate dehydrogenase / fumarate reductase, flavoprotein subunit
MSTITGLFVAGEANFSDHGANRLGASALMQGLSDGYFILPNSIGNYLAGVRPDRPRTDRAEFKAVEAQADARMKRLVGINGRRTATAIHKELGRLMWDNCGMERDRAGLSAALAAIPAIREEFWRNVTVPGTDKDFNQALEIAGRVADFLELAELMCLDALHREESCGGHFRTEYQTPDGEALRNDDDFVYAAAWEYRGEGEAPVLHKESLTFEYVKLAQRSYR